MRDLKIEQLNILGYKVGKVEDFIEVGRVLPPFGEIGFSVICEVSGTSVVVITDFGNTCMYTLAELEQLRVIPEGLIFYKYDAEMKPLYYAEEEIMSIIDRLKIQASMNLENQAYIIEKMKGE